MDAAITMMQEATSLTQSARQTPSKNVLEAQVAAWNKAASAWKAIVYALRMEGHAEQFKWLHDVYAEAQKGAQEAEAKLALLDSNSNPSFGSGDVSQTDAPAASASKGDAGSSDEDGNMVVTTNAGASGNLHHDQVHAPILPASTAGSGKGNVTPIPPVSAADASKGDATPILPFPAQFVRLTAPSDVFDAAVKEAARAMKKALAAHNTANTRQEWADVVVLWNDATMALKQAIKMRQNDNDGYAAADGICLAQAQAQVAEHTAIAERRAAEVGNNDDGNDRDKEKYFNTTTRCIGSGPGGRDRAQ
jgi:hypothetical protein